MLIVGLVAAAALTVPSSRVSAAGNVGPPAPGQPRHGDYYVYAETCTGSDAAYNCGFLYAQTYSPAASGAPVYGYFGCDTGGTNLPEREAWVQWGYPSSEGTGTVAGTTSVTAPVGTSVQASTFLVGSWASHYFEGAGTGLVTGFATGFVTINDAPLPPTYEPRVTSGAILITVRGAIANYSNDTVSQGTMACSIAPSSYYDYGYATQNNVD